MQDRAIEGLTDAATRRLCRVVGFASSLWGGLTACTPEEACFEAECRPTDLAPFTVTTSDPSRSVMATGRLLLTQLDDNRISYATIIDGEGVHRWWFGPRRPGSQKLVRSRLTRDGERVVIGMRHPDNRKIRGQLVEVDLATGEVLREQDVGDYHHEHVELADGRFAHLSRRRVPDEWFGSDFLLASDTVEFASLDGGDPEVVVDLLELDIKPTWICGHVEPRGFVTDAIDWTHSNSLVVDPDTGDITLGVRHFDAIARFDAAGEIRWWIGAPPGQQTSFGVVTPYPNALEPLDGARPPRHGHFGEAWSDGLIVFDNGNHTRRATRIVEYAVDAEAGTYHEVWSYPHPGGRQFQARGDAIRLPGGNVLVSWSGFGEIWEITREGDVVWQADTEQKVLRIQFIGEE